MKSVFSVLILLLSVASSFSQQTNKGITKEEEREALQVARLFEKRMNQTHDIAPLIKEFFVQDFLQRHRDYSKEEWLLIFRKEVARKVSLRDLRRFYVAENNWVYLFSLYYYSHHASTDDIPEDEFGDMPPAVFREMKRSLFYELVSKDSKNNSKVFVEGGIRSVHFYSYLKLMERVVKIYRRYVKRGDENSQAYRKSLIDWKNRFHTFEPQVSPCDDDCVGFPKGTRFIYVNVMPFQLQLVRYKGQMKILIAYMYFN